MPHSQQSGFEFITGSKGAEVRNAFLLRGRVRNATHRGGETLPPTDALVAPYHRSQCKQMVGSTSVPFASSFAPDRRSFLVIPMSTSPSSSPAKAAVEPPSGTCRRWRHLAARVFTAPACVEPAMFASSTQTQVMLQLTDWRTSSEFDQSSSRGQKHDLALDVPASGSFMGPPRIRQRERAVDGDAHGARIEQTPQFCELWTV